VDPVIAASAWERIVIWLPALLVGFGIVGAVFILLGRAFVATAREWEHPRLVYGGVVALVALVVLLTWLGVELPRE